ncbi:MAG TPA: ferrous iron transport protein B [Rhodospirillaceae bacterium]|nr:ferrous iron transport protein B [Rhodospirillaceae bacterium]
MSIAGKAVTVALTGNPNSGKTTLFNRLTGANAPVGNYPRVTLTPHRREIIHRGWTITVVDLPGIYSLTSQTPEERTARDFIHFNAPDIVLNVIDSGNLDRSLFLTTQLIEMGRPRVHALNMMDEARRKGIAVDTGAMASMLGGAVVETVALTGDGFDALLDAIVAAAEAETVATGSQITYDRHLEQTIARVTAVIDELHPGKLDRSQSHWLAIKLLEGDDEVLAREGEHTSLIELIRRERESLARNHGEQVDTMIADARYGFINGMLQEVRTLSQAAGGTDLTRRLDRIILNRFLGLPVFLASLWIMFEATFSLGKYPTDWINAAVKAAGTFLNPVIPPGMLHDVVIDGVIAGIGGTLVFLPNIVILFFFLALFSETGYLARTAFLVDRLMHPFGLHGKAFIPLVMGFDCNVPAIMAARTIESPHSRLIAILVSPFMACSARLPVFVLFAGAFFAEWAGTVVFVMYVISILAAMIAAVMIGRFLKGEGQTAFAMELPPYRLPTLRAVWFHMWERAQSFLQKVGGVILVGSVVIWFLQAFPNQTAETEAFDARITAAQAQDDTPERADLLAQLELQKNQDRLVHSYLGRASQAVTPLFGALGFDWRDTTAILTGFVAKEVVVASYAVLYNQSEEGGKDGLKVALAGAMPPLRAFAFMVFILLYSPCLSTIAVIWREAGSWRWSAFSVAFSFGFAWVLAWLVLLVGGLIT